MEFMGFITIDPAAFNVWSLRVSMSLTTIIFILGCFMALRAFLYLRPPDMSQLERVKDKEITPSDGFAESVAKILWSTVQTDQSEGQIPPRPFLHDATRQVAENMFHGKFIEKISLCSNLLPPIGLWGTVAGMIVIFLYTGDPGNALNKGAVGTKLWSTFLALFYYVSLEGIVLLLVMKSRKSLDRGLSVKL